MPLSFSLARRARNLLLVLNPAGFDRLGGWIVRQVEDEERKRRRKEKEEKKAKRKAGKDQEVRAPETLTMNSETLNPEP